jgi:Protein of unknown function (DUF998)
MKDVPEPIEVSPSTARVVRPSWLGMGFWALSLIVFATGTYLASLSYPGPFEWQFELISTLLSYKDNPNGYFFQTTAVTVAALLLIPAFVEISRAFKGRYGRLAQVALVLGIIGVCFAAIVGIEKAFFPKLSKRVRKLHDIKIHEILAAISIGCLVLSAAAYGFMHAKSPTPRWKRALSIGLVVSVPLGMVISQWYLRRTLPNAGWVGPEWKELGISPFLSFALWQWLFVLCSYLMVFVLLHTARSMSSTEC